VGIFKQLVCIFGQFDRKVGSFSQLVFIMMYPCLMEFLTCFGRSKLSACNNITTTISAKLLPMFRKFYMSKC